MSVAIITGASRGLGLALATGLVENGWQLVIDARDARALSGARDQLGGDVLAVPGDITDPAHRSALRS
ncbi:MAG TPA: SDR family NAD(P)-dependent oxidoreductase, partial [Pseudonocardiaceae bacterium]|nr:SDR family NAD(P)-dependent oxidoreductase [Pseudonocardiaceae bacterium]